MQNNFLPWSLSYSQEFFSTFSLLNLYVLCLKYKIKQLFRNIQIVIIQKDHAYVIEEAFMLRGT